MSVKEFVKKNYHNILLVLYFVIQLILHRYVYLYGDDYFYGTFIRDNFWGNHVEHYMRVNGRALVHFVISLMLAFDVHLFRIVNPLIIIGLIVVTARFAASNEKDYQLAVAGGIILFSLLSISITRESVYWLTGSFNYLFASFLSVAALYVIRKSVLAGKFKPCAAALALLASMTVEQSSLITFGGILVIVLFHRLVRKGGWRNAFYLYPTFSLIGVCTVVFAPGTFVRAELEHKVNVLANLKGLYKLSFMTNHMLVYHVGLALVLLFWLANVKEKSISRVVLLVGNFGYIVSSVVAGYKMKDLEYFAFPTRSILNGYRLLMALYILLVALYILSVLYFAFYCMLRRNDERVLMSVLAAAGAQLMLIVSPVFGNRTLLCSILMLYIPILTGIGDIYSRETTDKGILRAALLVMLLIAAIPMYRNIQGYKTNAPCNEYNLDAIRQFQAQGSTAETIDLQKMKLHDYGWSYPYQSKYHMRMFKKYYGISNDVVIEFK